MRTRFFPARTWLVAVCLAAVVATVAGAAFAGPDEGYIGVYMQRLTKELSRGLDLKIDKGVMISGVAEDSPAETAGIEDGDVIVKFNGEAVSTPRELRELVEAVEPGTSADVELVREGKTMTVTLTVGEQPDDMEMWFDGDNFNFNQLGDLHRNFARMGHFANFPFGPRLGVQASELNDDLAGYFKAEAGKGVLVLDVEEKSVAAEAGVKAGDVIQKIGNEEIGSIRDIRDSISEFDEGDEFSVSVLRKGKKQELKATMDDQDQTVVFNGGPRRHGRHAPMRMKVGRDDLRKELDDLRRELRELKRDLGRDDG